MIKAVISGYIGRDPEQRTYNDQTVTSFSVAARTSRKDKDTGMAVTEWVNVSIWGKRGDFWYNNLSKGSKVIVTGELTHRVYTKKDGSTDFSLEMSCDDIENCTPRTEQSGEGAPAAGNNPLGGFTEVDDGELPF